MLVDMPASRAETRPGLKDQVIQILKGLPWGSLLVDLVKLIGSLLSKGGGQGLYEVLEYESTLELLDTKGKRARFSKCQKVRYLQDNIIAYQDQAWGDGKILLDYKCSPGVAVDQYRFGHKTLVLISLREVKQQGDLDEFHIRWGIEDGFKHSHEQWETEISHPTRRIKLGIVFPKKRSPQQVDILEGDKQKQVSLVEKSRSQLPNGRWRFTYELSQPRLFERYIIKWDW